jgi:glycosyltransferase 2 family protein
MAGTHKNLNLDETGLTAGQPSVLKTLLRFGIGGMLIGLLLWSSDTDAIAKAFVGASLPHVAISVVLLLGVFAVSAFRWRSFLRPLGFELSAGPAIRLYFVGMFFNAFLPTGVGGDAYKAIRIRRGPGTLASAFASVLLDRIAGVFGLALIGIAAVSVQIASGDRAAPVLVSLLVAIAVLLAAALLLTVGDRLLGQGRSNWFGLRPKLRRVLAAAMIGGRDSRAVLWGLVGGVAAQLLVLGAHIALAQAIGLRVPIAALAASLLVAAVAATLPITINGIGVREAVWVWSLGAYGVSDSYALAFALLALGMNLVSSALGGVVYALAGSDIQVEETARTWRSQGGDESLYSRERDLGTRIARWLHRGETLLDLGGGTGRISRWLLTHAEVRPTVSDISPRRKPVTGIPFITQKDALHVPVDNKSFDVVMILFVFHHIEEWKNQDGLLGEAIRIARRRLIIIEDTATSRLELSLNKAFDWLFNAPQGIPTPFTFRKAHDWLDIFLGLKLSVVHIETYRPVWPQFKTYANTLYVLDC